MSQVTLSMPAQPFDVAGLRDALPGVGAAAAPLPVQRAQIDNVAGAGWAADFLARQPVTTQAQLSPATRVEQQNRVQTPASHMGGMQGAPVCSYAAVFVSDLHFFSPFRLHPLAFFFSGPGCRRCTSVELGICRVRDGSDGRYGEYDGSSGATTRRTE